MVLLGGRTTERCRLFSVFPESVQQNLFARVVHGRTQCAPWFALVFQTPDFRFPERVIAPVPSVFFKDGDAVRQIPVSAGINSWIMSEQFLNAVLFKPISDNAGIRIRLTECAWASAMDGFDNLTSVKGIGAKGASTLLSVIGNNKKWNGVQCAVFLWKDDGEKNIYKYQQNKSKDAQNNQFIFPLVLYIIFVNYNFFGLFVAIQIVSRCHMTTANRPKSR